MIALFCYDEKGNWVLFKKSRVVKEGRRKVGMRDGRRWYEGTWGLPVHGLYYDCSE